MSIRRAPSLSATARCRDDAWRSAVVAVLVLGTSGFTLNALGATAVGRVGGEFDTTATGAAAYTIPIQVAAGMNGLKPSIALSYHSQAGDGLAGHGWTLSGFSEITRCGLTRALDGRVQGVRFIAQDRYCLDGQPLVLLSGTHGAAGAEYRPEVHAYERVISQGQQGSGPAWFEVRHPDGMVYRYGNDADSRVEATGTTEVRAWALNEIEDRFQQRIGFAYTEDSTSGEHSPAEVRWTYGAGDSFDQARYRVALAWEPLPVAEIRAGFLWGSASRSSQRLTAMNYEFNDGSGFRRVHRYSLSYTTPAPDSHQRSLLASVTQCGPLDCLPPTTMQWDQDAAERTTQTIPGIPVDKSVFGDFNGDGATDVFGSYQSRWAVWPADPQTGGFLSPVTIGGTFGSTSIGIPLDYNGDGLTDLMTGSSQGPNWLVYLAPTTAAGTFQVKNTGVPWSATTEVEPMDIDGDALDDLVYLRNGMAYIRRNSGAALSAEQAGGIGPVPSPNIAFTGGKGFVESADFDGDGRRDLLVARSQVNGSIFRWEVFLAESAGFARDPIATLTTTPNRWNVIVLDMNGDGLSDVLRFDGLQWQPMISRGTSTSAGPGVFPVSCPAPLTEAAGNKVAALDLDADGRSELVIKTRGGWAIHRSDGSCFSSVEDYSVITSPNSIDYGRVMPIDTNGDGNPDVMFGSTGLDRWVLSRPVPGTRPDGTPLASRGNLLRQIVDGLGNSHEIFYTPLTGWPGYQWSGTVVTQPRVLRGGPLPVVSQYRTNTGIGEGRYSVALSYSNGRIDTAGRGFLGFETLKATDSRNGIVTDTRYRVDFPFAGRREQTSVWNGTDRVSVYDPSWSASITTVPDAARDSHFVHLAGDLEQAYEVDRDGGAAGTLVRSVKRSLTWNFNHGAVTTELTEASSPQQAGTTFRTTRAVTLDEGLRNSAGCLGFPARVEVTRDISGAGAMSRSVQYTYNTSCRVVTQADGPTSIPAQQLWTIYGYDALGRSVTVTRTDGASALPPRRMTLAYGATGFRPATESWGVNGEPDLVVTHAWNDALGLETSRTGAQGQTTTWQYDEFGRIRSELRPAGSTQTTYAGCGTCFAPHARYSVKHRRSDGYWTESQHDSFGRTVGGAFVLPDSRASRKIIEYDQLGRLSRESVPYRDDAAAVYWNTYGYDLLGRPKTVDRPVSESSPSGSTSRIVYAANSTMVTDAEAHATAYVHDAEGRVISVQAPLGSGATYGYDAFGQVRSITDAAGNTRQLTYDDRGLLLQATDPDAGRRTFAYNAFGEVTSQADGKTPPGIVTMQYDQLGRLTSRTEPEGTTTWAYSPVAGPSRGLLQQVTAPMNSSATGFREAYLHDGQGRLQRTSSIIDGTTYVTDYGYTVENKLASMTYPATIGWRPKFQFSYSNGHLTLIAQETPAVMPVYTLLAMDAAGHDTAVRFGNGALEERTVHDSASSRLMAIQSGPPANPANVQNYLYEWDRVGNLRSRQDQAANPRIDERFAYDSLNRLTQATLNGAATVTLAYSPDGNILSKSDVGNYSYGTSGQRPHAVTAIAGGPRGAMSFSYDANGNMSARNGSAITWTSFNLPGQISAGSDYARFAYGPARARVSQEVRTSASTRTVHYVGPHFEVEIAGAARRYRANVFAYGRAVYSQVEATPNGLEAYYVLHDHQGSVDRLVRAAGAGSDLHALSFDAWGKRRNTNWTADPKDQRTADAHWIERGYTGHEHLDNVRLIHMNGRLEDPVLGRMISPDPVPGNLMNPQTLNPYSYVANDPTSFVDPSGYFLGRIGKFFKRGLQHIGSFARRLVRRWGRQLVAVVSAYFTAGAASSWAYAANLPDISVSLASPAFASAGGFAAASTLTAAVPASVLIGGFAGGAVAGAISSGNAKGAAFGALTGGITAGIGGYYGGSYSAGRVLAEASFGGAAAELQGGDFGQGFLTSGTLSSVTWASLEMRRVMIEQSRLNPANATGVSDGLRGDGFKLGGCRSSCTRSPLGGVQGGPGRLFGMAYEPGSFVDHLIETYSGPHDFLNAPFFYDALGNSVGRPGVLGLVNGGNVLVATPFAAASVIPSYAYQAFD